MTRLVVQIEHPHKETGAFQIEFQDQQVPYVRILTQEEHVSDCIHHLADYFELEMLHKRLRATFSELVSGDEVKFGEYMWQIFIAKLAQYITVLLTETRGEQPVSVST